MKKTFFLLAFFMSFSNAWAYQIQCQDIQGVLTMDVQASGITLDFSTPSDEVAILGLQVTASHQMDLAQVNGIRVRAENVSVLEPFIFVSNYFSQYALDIRYGSKQILFSEDFVGLQNHQLTASLLKTPSGSRFLVDIWGYNTESVSPVFEQVKKSWVYDFTSCRIN